MKVLRVLRYQGLSRLDKFRSIISLSKISHSIWRDHNTFSQRTGAGENLEKGSS